MTTMPSINKSKPKKKRGLIIGFIFIVSIIPFFLFFYSQEQHSSQRKNLEKNGVKTEATIISYHSTQNFYNNVPKLAFKIKLSVPSGKPIVTHTEEYIDMVDFSKLHNGLVIPAVVDPKDSHKFSLLWGEAGIRTLF